MATDPDPRSWSDPGPADLAGDGIARFEPPASLRDDQAIPPSVAVIAAARPLGPVPVGFGAAPRFARADGRWIVRVPAPEGTSFYGTGEVCGRLRRNGTKVVCWNTDAFEYDDTRESLYQSHPWVLAVRPDGSSFGVIADTTFRCAIELDGAITFTAEGLPFAVWIIERDEPGQVVAALADLTGRPPLPPKWALGYHQSRWSYEPASRVLKHADDFRAHRMPCDAIWLDIDYMDGFRCFTFDRTKFPDPKRLNDELHARGFRSVWMIDCGIKADPEYAVYAAGCAGGHFIATDAGGEYHGSVWPGPSAFPDYTREATRRWWADLYRDFAGTGLDGVWNDMNEPAVFDNPAKHVPETLRHRADEALGGPDAHARYHNVYGMLMARATREGIARARPDKRPFVLTRANFLGGHRYAATWTGDNKADWDHLAWSIPMVLNLGLSGQPFAGPDIGGFSGNADARLFRRWFAFGVLLPFARVHSIKDSADREPWAMGEEVARTCRLALERRYRLLPYLYTLFHEASRSGLPVARPLFFADPRDPALRDADDAFLLGDALMVRVRTKPLGACEAPMPRGAAAWRRVEPVGHAGNWADFDLDPELPELYIRAGSIVPLGPVMQFADERPLDPLTLLVCPGPDGRATGTLYEDAGEGRDYTQGLFRLSTWRAHSEAGRVIVRADPPLGRLHPPDRVVEVVVLLDGGVVRSATGRAGRVIEVVFGPGEQVAGTR
ncbi:MAG: TIM-barrel domain-containing protein [Phycisphaerales bacterium]